MTAICESDDEKQQSQEGQIRSSSSISVLEEGGKACIGNHRVKHQDRQDQAL